MPGQFRSAGDILFTDHPPMPGLISDVQLKQFSETSNFLQCLVPLTPDKPFFFAQIRALCMYSVVLNLGFFFFIQKIELKCFCYQDLAKFG